MRCFCSCGCSFDDERMPDDVDDLCPDCRLRFESPNFPRCHPTAVEAKPGRALDAWTLTCRDPEHAGWASHMYIDCCSRSLSQLWVEQGEEIPF